MDFLKAIVKEHKPKKQDYDKIRLEIQSFINALEKQLAKKKIKAKAMLGGSAAKGTILKDDFDCDVFVRFDRSAYNDDELSDLLEKALEIFDCTLRLHGSRDYFQLAYDGINFEIIPVLDVENARQAVNVTDMSPLHVSWISQEIERKPNLIDEIILAKAFCKANSLYGAESYIRGFSGHVLDILIVYYGSFTSLLENACNWQRFKVIDVAGHGGAEDIDKSKISPLILIDPIDRRRNAAAALGEEKFQEFRKLAKEFTKKPAKEFFEKKRLSLEALKKMADGQKLLIVTAESHEGKKDVSGSKLLKAYELLRKHIILDDFSLLQSGWDWDQKKKARFWYIVDKQKLSEKRLRIGPPIREKDDAARFCKKHPDCYEKDKRLYAEVEREYTSPEDLAKVLISSDHFTQKAKDPKLSVY